MIGPKARWLLWVVLLAGWTGLLMIPDPSLSALGLADPPRSLRYAIAKGMHLGVYALLTMLAGWAKAPARFRWGLVFVLTTHATLTELVQCHIPGRTGTLEDVGFDHLGVLIGILVAWRSWTQP